MTRPIARSAAAELTRYLGYLPALGLTLLVALGLVFGPAQSANAADGTGTITYAEPTSDGLQVLVSVPAGAKVDLDAVTVTVDSQKAESTAARVEADDSVQRITVLAIDTSKSSAGKKLASRQDAARQFINTAPADVSIGIVTFDSDVTTALPPTQDRAAALEAVESLELSKQTMLFDGILAAVDAAGDEGQRNVLVLSGGVDTGQTPIDTVTSAVDDSGVRLDVVAAEQSGDALEVLTSLANAGDGDVIASDYDALNAAFADQAAALAAQVLVTVQVPRSVERTEATLKVTLPTADGQVTAEAFTTVRSSALASDVAAPSSGWSPPGWVLYAGPAAVGLGLIVVAVLLVPKPKAVSAADRVSQYTDALGKPNQHSGPLLDTDVAFASAKETAASMLSRNKDLDARISRRLEAAGSELKSSEWLLMHGGIFFVSGLVGIAIGGGNPVIGLIFLAMGLFVPWLYLGFRRSRRRKAFNQGLPDTLQLMSGSLAAGLSLAQSVDTIVREGSEPISGEFRRVLVETRLGVSLEDALEGVGERFESKDFEWVVMAIKIQRQVGGNLAELLDTVAATMREREYVRRQVAALAAEGKLSAWVLGGLPPVFMLYLLLANRDYVIVMFQEPLGWAMLAGAATILAVGVFWMSRLVKVEV
jgi:tight adherence protein B